MSLVYNVRFSPGRYYVCPMGGSGAAKIAGVMPTPGYFAVVDETTRQPVAYTFDENAAKAVCFSLDLTNAILHGDKAREREMLRALEKTEIPNNA